MPVTIRRGAQRPLLASNRNVQFTPLGDISALPVNQAPVVNAGADASPMMPETGDLFYQLAGLVTDDGLTESLTILWNYLSGPAGVGFDDQSLPTATLQITAAGTYTFELTADDGEYSAADEVVITVSPYSAPPSRVRHNNNGIVMQYDESHSGAALDLWTLTDHENIQVSDPFDANASLPLIVRRPHFTKGPVTSVQGPEDVPDDGQHYYLAYDAVGSASDVVDGKPSGLKHLLNSIPADKKANRIIVWIEPGHHVNVKAPFLRDFYWLEIRGVVRPTGETAYFTGRINPQTGAAEAATLFQWQHSNTFLFLCDFSASCFASNIIGGGGFERQAIKSILLLGHRCHFHHGNNPLLTGSNGYGDDARKHDLAFIDCEFDNSGNEHAFYATGNNTNIFGGGYYHSPNFGHAIKSTAWHSYARTVTLSSRSLDGTIRVSSVGNSDVQCDGSAALDTLSFGDGMWRDCTINFWTGSSNGPYAVHQKRRINALGGDRPCIWPTPATGMTTTAGALSGAVSSGGTSVTIDGLTNGNTVYKGDTIAINGEYQLYVHTGSDATVTGGAVTLTLSPPLVSDYADDAPVMFTGLALYVDGDTANELFTLLKLSVGNPSFPRLLPDTVGDYWDGAWWSQVVADGVATLEQIAINPAGLTTIFKDCTFTIDTTAQATYACINNQGTYPTGPYRDIRTGNASPFMQSDDGGTTFREVDNHIDLSVTVSIGNTSNQTYTTDNTTGFSATPPGDNSTVGQKDHHLIYANDAAAPAGIQAMLDYTDHAAYNAAVARFANFYKVIDLDNNSGAYITEETPANMAPTVYAGMDDTVTLPDTASLNGTINDDGAFTSLWTKISGPGSVTFGDDTAIDTTATFGAAGSYLLRLTADDGEFVVSDDVAITVNAAAMPNTLVVTLELGADDGDENASSGGMDRFGPTLTIGDRYVALVYRDISIPQGATIDSAHVQFADHPDYPSVGATTTGTCTTDIYCEDVDDCAFLTDALNNISTRTRTTATVPWTLPDWVSGDETDDQKTPDIKTCVQEVIDRPGWVSENKICILLWAGTGARHARDRNQKGPTAGATLTIDYFDP